MNKDKLLVTYQIYDSRYYENPDRAVCFEVCDTLREAQRSRNDYGNNNIIVESKNKKIGVNQYLEISSRIIE